jgi:hypothetical protein
MFLFRINKTHGAIFGYRHIVRYGRESQNDIVTAGVLGCVCTHRDGQSSEKKLIHPEQSFWLLNSSEKEKKKEKKILGEDIHLRVRARCGLIIALENDRVGSRKDVRATTTTTTTPNPSFLCALVPRSRLLSTVVERADRDQQTHLITGRSC